MTINRRDWLLQQMGINQFELRRPMALRGEVAVSLPSHIRLIVIARQTLDFHQPLLTDILRAMSLPQEAVYSLTPDKVAMLPEITTSALWLIGEVELPPALTDRTLCLISPELDILAKNPNAKLQLWQQIYQNEHHFFPNH